MNRTLKTVIFWMVIAVSATLLWQVVRSSHDERNTSEISYSRFMSDVESGNVASVKISGSEIQGWYREGKGAFRLFGPTDSGAYLDALRKNGVEIRFGDVRGDSLPLQLLGTWAPLILLGALWFFMIRQMQVRRASRRDDSPSGGGTFGPSDGSR